MQGLLIPKMSRLSAKNGSRVAVPAQRWSLFFCAWILFVGLRFWAISWIGPSDTLHAATSIGTPLRWESAHTHRKAPVHRDVPGKIGFIQLTEQQTGIAFTNSLSDQTISINRLTEIGSGVALGDIDGDGWVDIYFCRSEGGNALFRNLGNWKFEDITLSSGTVCSNQFSTGAVFADMDGDSDLDLLVNGLGTGTRLFLNDGKGHFTEKTDSGLARDFGATSIALADVDGDGDLDLYVTNYRSDTFQDRPPGLNITSRQLPDGSTVIEPRERMLGLLQPSGGLTGVERGQLDVFYLNRGNARFSAAPWDVGVFLDEKGKALSEPPTDWGLSALFRDINGDGLPDLYVCNDFVYWPDRIWLNAGGKRFQAPVRHSFRNTSLSSMSADMADINRDGFMDLFTADMLSPHRSHRAWQRPDVLEGTVDWPVEDPSHRPEVTRNTLQLARGDGTFAEIAQLAGLAATDWTWSSSFLDVDLDGWEDLLVTTGSNHELQDIDSHESRAAGGFDRNSAERLEKLRATPRRSTPSLAFRNRRDLTFEDVSHAWGFDAIGVAHGMAFADLDNDGDLDVVINCMNSPARLLRNNSGAPRIGIRLKAAGANTRGISAKIQVTGGPVSQSQEMVAGGRYLSGDDAMRVFATGATQALNIEVTWRSGRKTRVEGALPYYIYEVLEDVTSPVPTRTTNAPVLGWFEDQTARLNHRHVDRAFNDFERDPLLPYKLSRLGPGLCLADVDGDGHEDLLIGGGIDGQASVFGSDGKGHWREGDYASLPKSNLRDQTSLLVVANTDGSSQLLVGESAWEEGATNAHPFRVYSLSTTASNSNSLPSSQIASGFTGPMAMADVDGDGALEIFVGGRAIPGRYPETATSTLLDASNGVFASRQSFPNLGLVSGATFVDIDNDGDQDLLIASHWGAPRLFLNERGVFVDATKDWGLTNYAGLWNGIAVGDFDGDGLMDFVASNWGLNWRTDEPIDAKKAVQLVYGDFGETGGVVALLASLDPDLGASTFWRERRRVSRVIPTLSDRFPTYRAYGTSTVTTALGHLAAASKTREASEFRSMVFLNRTNHFEARSLPIEAQFSTAFGLAVADFDGNGTEDLFLSQNFFGMDPETSRQDAGTGLLLLGDGRGGFKSVNPVQSGLWIEGEQRAVAVGDVDEDGRPDLIIAQNGGATRVYRNRQATPGLRVRVQDSVQNPRGIGAILRLKIDGHFGPARAITGGGGYWTQSSATQILIGSGSSSAVEVRWPNGKLQEFILPLGAKSILITHAGLEVKSVN